MSVTSRVTESHCRSLICFVYDPQHYLANPAGLIADLSRLHDGLPVRIIAGPAT